MLRPQNFRLFIVRVFIAIVLFSLTLPAITAATTWTFTTTVEPPEGGTISPSAGIFQNGAEVPVTIKANPGWFIYYVGINNELQTTRDELDDEAFKILLYSFSQLLSPPPTNVSAATKILWNKELTVRFWPLAPSVAFKDVVTVENFKLTPDVRGLWPLKLEWRKDGTILPGETTDTISFLDVDPSMSATYTLTATSRFGSATASAKVDIRSILCSDEFLNPILTNSLSFTNSLILNLRTRYKEGHIFYTLDGSEPTFASSELSDYLVLDKTADLRAVAYSSDFSASAMLDQIHFEKIPTVAITYITNGLGTIEGQTSDVLNGSTLTLRAVPEPGSFFVVWDAADIEPTPEITIKAEKNMFITASFATPLVTPVGGQGSVEIEPKSPGYVPGLPVSLYPKPAPGYYFARWAGLDKPTIPLTMVPGVQTPPTALFVPLPEGKVSLIVITRGSGGVSGVNTNVYSVGSSLSLQANPVNEGRFRGWAGDAASTNQTLVIEMTTSKVIYAEFEKRPRLWFPRERNGLIELTGDIGFVNDLYSSSDLIHWQLEFTKTNFDGRVFGRVSETDPPRFFKGTQRNIQ